MALARHTLGAAAASNAALAKFVEDCGDPASIEVAEVYAWRGEGDLAFEWLERAIAARNWGMRTSACDPMLRSLHSDPRWTVLMQKHGLGNAHAVGT